MTVVTDRSRLRALLGDLPVRTAPRPGTLRDSRKRGDASIEDWRLDLNDALDVPATLVLPLQAPRAIVLYCHAHGNNFTIGRGELLCGRPALAQPPYGESLPQLGFAAVAIDHRGFGDRATPGERVLNKRLLWEGRTLWGMRIADTLSVYDWLRAQERFAHLPIVTLGLSMGSTMSTHSAGVYVRPGCRWKRARCCSGTRPGTSPVITVPRNWPG